ncbi:MAG: hypothetical protein IT306_26555 [Chloroflexi bacterium]|nr:hypothetical protein [Chloroflexota bacterium]
METTTASADLVLLRGTPAEAGAAYGRATRACIQRYVADFLTNVEAEGIGLPEIQRRTDLYHRIVDRLAPWWHEDVAAIASAAGVATDAYAAYVAQKYVIRTTRPPSPPPAEHECTSFVSVGRASASGASILHKNRDSAARPQGLWIRHDAGCYRYLAGGDSGDHGVIHFLNEKGLAGAMNAGSASSDTAPDGWPTPQILRLIAEKAASCQEALEILREIVGQGWYTNGARGSIWFFVDRERGMIVENTRHDLDYTWIDDQVVARANDFLLPGTRRWAAPDALTNTRYVSARDGAAALNGQVTPFALTSLGRDEATLPRAMCSDSTLSGFSASVGEGPLGALVCVGNPASGVAVPFYVKAAGVPSFVMDGRLWSAAEMRRRARVSATSNGSPAVPDVSQVQQRILHEHDEQATRWVHLDATARAEALTAASARWSGLAFTALIQP